jgi:hypothetical protein
MTRPHQLATFDSEPSLVVTPNSMSLNDLVIVTAALCTAPMMI